MKQLNEPIIFITGNINKVQEVSHYLDHPIEHIDLDLTEIQSLSLREIIEHKAKEAYKQVQKTVLVEDVSLTFTAFGKLPGPFIKWFLKELGTEKTCRLLDNVSDRSATAEIAYGLYDGEKLKIFEGIAEGTIAHHPKGDKSFGWSPIFIPNGYTKTWAEMEFEEHTKTSMRRKALIKLEKYLKTYAQ